MEYQKNLSTKYILENGNIDETFVTKFLPYLLGTEDMVNIDDIKQYIGNGNNQFIKDTIFNDEYGFIENMDYKIGKSKEVIFLSPDTIKCICLMLSTDKSNKFRRDYMKMEKLYKQYVLTEINK